MSNELRLTRESGEYMPVTSADLQERLLSEGALRVRSGRIEINDYDRVARHLTGTSTNYVSKVLGLSFGEEEEWLITEEDATHAISAAEILREGSQKPSLSDRIYSGIGALTKIVVPSPTIRKVVGGGLVAYMLTKAVNTQQASAGMNIYGPQAPGEAGWNEPYNREDKVELNDTVFREWEAYNDRPDPIDFEFNVTSRELGWEAEPLHEEFTLNYGETRIVNYTTWGPSEGDDGEEERAVIQLRTEDLYKSTDARTTLVVPPENNTEEPVNDKSLSYVSPSLASLTLGAIAVYGRRKPLLSE